MNKSITTPRSTMLALSREKREKALAEAKRAQAADLVYDTIRNRYATPDHPRLAAFLAKKKSERMERQAAPFIAAIRARG